MAVTIHQTPADYTPSDNKMVWVFSSNNTTEENFYYLIKTYINDVEVQQDEVYVQNGIYSKFDASSIASRYAPVITLSDEFVDDANLATLVKIEIIERYGDPVADGDSLLGSNITCFKSRVDTKVFQSWDYTTYNTAFMTYFPTSSNPKVRLDEQIRLLILTEGESQDVTVTTYDSSDVQLETDTITYASLADFLTINASPQTIIDKTLITPDWDDVAYYTISSINTSLSEPRNEKPAYRIDINTDCEYSKSQRIHFLTKLGNVESLSFDLFSRENWRVESFGYEKEYGTLNGDTYTLDVQDGVEIDYKKRKKGTLTVVSDWLEEDVINWFTGECYMSPIVYIEEGLTVADLQRTRILSQAYREMVQENDTLVQEEIELSLIPESSMIV